MYFVIKLIMLIVLGWLSTYFNFVLYFSPFSVSFFDLASVSIHTSFFQLRYVRIPRFSRRFPTFKRMLTIFYVFYFYFLSIVITQSFAKNTTLSKAIIYHYAFKLYASTAISIISNQRRICNSTEIQFYRSDFLNVLNVLEFSLQYFIRGRSASSGMYCRNCIKT